VRAEKALKLFHVFDLRVKAGIAENKWLTHRLASGFEGLTDRLAGNCKGVLVCDYDGFRRAEALPEDLRCFA